MMPLHFSALKWMAKSPAHFKWNMEHPPKQSVAMRYGEALDALLFGTKKVLTFDGASRRNKAWTTFADENPEAVLLVPSERVEVAGMLLSLQANTEAMLWLTHCCERQKTIAWTMAGRECEGTPDVYASRGLTPGQVVELKTTRNGNPEKFPWDGRRLVHHAQLAWYHNALVLLDLIEPGAPCRIVAVENTAPYVVTLFELTPRALLEGSKLWRLWFERLLVCESNDSWPGYSEAFVPFDTPDTETLTLKIEGEEMEIEVV